MPRMEDKIRRLCSELLVPRGEAELRQIVVELRDTLQQHIKRLRERFGSYPYLVERRARNDIRPVNRQDQDDAAKKKPA